MQRRSAPNVRMQTVQQLRRVSHSNALPEHIHGCGGPIIILYATTPMYIIP